MWYGKLYEQTNEMTENTGVAKCRDPVPIDEDEILDWDAALTVVPSQPSGTIKVLLKPIASSIPTIVVDDEGT